MRQTTARKHAALLQAVAHPTRLQILEKLAGGRTCVSELQSLVDVPQPNVSQHLAQLRKAGLVVCHKRGTVRCYHLAKPQLIRDLLAVLGRSYPEVAPVELETCGGAKRSGRKR